MHKQGYVEVRYWLVKSEPEVFSWADLQRDGRTCWDGVRNFQARNYLRAMAFGDEVLFYHSQGPREVVGVAIVCRTAYPDPTATDGDWSAVDLKPLRPLSRAVKLSQVREDALLQKVGLVRQGRLSVMPLTAAEFQRILGLGASA